MESEPKLKPLTLSFTRQYLGIDLPKIRASVTKLISQSEVYFSRPLDQARFGLSTADGKRNEDIPISDAARVFDLVETATVQMNLYFSVEQKTPNQMFTLIAPDEHISLTLDFYNHRFTLEVGIVGREKANQIVELLTEGVLLVTVELPAQHQYIEPFLHSFLKEHPSNERNVFLIMRFTKEPPFPEIVEAVRRTCAEKGLNILRADDKEYTDDLWDNVLTYMYGCDQAIAIFDQINYRKFNPNVALEVGFLRAQCKRVLLLKDKAIAVMPADIVGKIYRNFDTYAASETIPPQINKWLEDYGIGSAGNSTPVTLP